MTTNDPAVSVVVPVRNEAENIAPLVGEIARALEGQWAFEVVYVNDGSSDGTDAELERLTAIQSSMLLLAATGIDALAVRRGLKIEYFIFTDPLIILSGAVLLDRLRDLRFHKWAYAIAVTLLGLHVAVGQAEPVKYAFKRSGKESICEWNRFYLPLMPLPWCPGARS